MTRTSVERINHVCKAGTKRGIWTDELIASRKKEKRWIGSNNYDLRSNTLN